jgi:hypothetical protein
MNLEPTGTHQNTQGPDSVIYGPFQGIPNIDTNPVLRCRCPQAVYQRLFCGIAPTIRDQPPHLTPGHKVHKILLKLVWVQGFPFPVLVKNNQPATDKPQTTESMGGSSAAKVNTNNCMMHNARYFIHNEPVRLICKKLIYQPFSNGPFP